MQRKEETALYVRSLSLLSSACYYPFERNPTAKGEKEEKD